MDKIRQLVSSYNQKLSLSEELQNMEKITDWFLLVLLICNVFLHNAGSSLVPDSKPSTSQVGVGSKGTFKVTVEIVSPRLYFDKSPPAFSVTINGEQQETKGHITESDERPLCEQMFHPVTAIIIVYPTFGSTLQAFTVC